VDPRADLHALIEDLPDDVLPAAEAALRKLRDDPVGWAITHAPEDDEPYTARERAEVERRRAAAEAGDVVSHAEVRRMLDELK
jgi:hypothetical protein